MSVKIRLRALDMDAVGYDGTFPLDFLKRGERVQADPPRSTRGAIIIRTLYGAVGAVPGDWIIRHHDGSLSAVKPDVFERRYEVVA